MINTKVSVIMPVYNAESFVSESIDSVLNQTHKDIELILVDDCSKDNSYEILLEYAEKDERVRVFRNECNKGVSYTRNFAVSKAQFDYVALIDSDDIWDENKLQKQLEVIDKYPDTDICYTGSAYVDTQGVRSDFVFSVSESVSYEQLLKQNIISCSSVLIKRQLLVEYPMVYDNMHEDFIVWLCVLKDGGIARGIDEPLLVYRVDKDSKSGNKLKSMLMQYRVLRFMGLNIFEQMYYMAFYIVNGIKKHSSI